MLADVLGGLFLAVVSGGMLWAGLTPAKAIWQGDGARVPDLLAFMHIRVNARSYAAFLLWFVPVFGGMALLSMAFTLAALSHDQYRSVVALGKLGIGFVWVGVPLILVHVFVHAFNRPAFLVPPPYRCQPGGITEAVDRRRRKRNGRPPTDHVVEILELRPPTDIAKPYLKAVCTEPGCKWREAADDALDPPQADAHLRQRAASHTSVEVRAGRRVIR